MFVGKKPKTDFGTDGDDVGNADDTPSIDGDDMASCASFGSTKNSIQVFDRRLTDNSIMIDEKHSRSIGVSTDDQLPPLDEVTRAYIINRLRKDGKDINDQTIEEERQIVILEEGEYQMDWSRLASFTKKENVWLPVVLLAALCTGAHDPLLADLVVESVEILSECEPFRDEDGLIPQGEECIDKLDDQFDIMVYAVLNSLAGLIVFVIMGVGVGYIAGWAVVRIRKEAFAGLVRQDISYHDHPDHTSGLKYLFQK